MSPRATGTVPSGALSASNIPPGSRRGAGAPLPAGRISVSGPPALGGVNLQRFGPPPQQGQRVTSGEHRNSLRGAPPVSLVNTAAGRGLVGNDNRRRGSLDGGGGSGGRRGSMDAPQRIRGNFGGYD